MGTFLAELAIFIGVIIIGVKKSGSLGAVAILGLAIYVFCFGVVPTDPPLKIAILIFAIFFASSALGACGGFHYLTYLSGKAVAKYPKMITFIAPLVSFIFVMLCGSGYIIAALLPMIYDVAKKSGVRPERPITISVIAANQAVLCSPISAPFLALISILTPLGVDIKTILIVLTIATLCGVIGAAFSVYNMGEDLKPEDFPVDEKSLDDNLLKESFNKKTKIAVLFFLLTVIIIAILGIFENLRPTSIVNGVRTPMDITSMMVILTFSLSAIIIFFCGVKPSKIFEEQTFRMGGSVISSVFGISWISSTFIACNKAMIISFVSSVGAEHVWIFGVFVFILSIFITSHTAAILTLYPLGLMLGISPLSLLALTPAIDSVFILPSFPTIQVALEVDKTGSTHVGKYLINHSFIRPGMVTVIIGIIVSHLVVHFFFL
jgi:anaerobic C4-dicarboxylate transporter-like protein